MRWHNNNSNAPAAATAKYVIQYEPGASFSPNVIPMNFILSL